MQSLRLAVNTAMYFTFQEPVSYISKNCHLGWRILIPDAGALVKGEKMNT